MRMYSLAALLIGTFPMLANAEPSYNCDNASHVAEHVICGSQELSSLDRLIAKQYRQSLSDAALEKDKQTLRQVQRAWVTERNECEYSFDCLKERSLERLTTLKAIESFAFSWGGVLRESPTLESEQVGSTYERQAIVILQEEAAYWNGYPWFKVLVSGKTAYQWGGIICDTSRPNTTYCEE